MNKNSLQIPLYLRLKRIVNTVDLIFLPTSLLRQLRDLDKVDYFKDFREKLLAYSVTTSAEVLRLGAYYSLYKLLPYLE